MQDCVLYYFIIVEFVLCVEYNINARGRKFMWLIPNTISK